MLWLVLIMLACPCTLGSWGDQAPVYRSCMGDCLEGCRGDSLEAWRAAQPGLERLVGWSCAQDCSYSCMWTTVQVYGEKGRVPQFHGKWPFLRVLGLQEPASVLASGLNLAAALHMLGRFVAAVPRGAEMYWVWVFYSLTAINAWVWSVVFHAMDTPTTEALDYFSALLTVLASLLAFALRLAVGRPATQAALATAFLAFYGQHVHHMATVSFDYGYNMKVNVASGGLNCIAWLIWFCVHRADGRHILPGVLGVLLVTSAVLLEVLDFPPIYWVLDSHALWHFATVPLPLLWLRFAAGDALLSEELKQKKKS